MALEALPNADIANLLKLLARRSVCYGHRTWAGSAVRFHGWCQGLPWKCNQAVTTLKHISAILVCISKSITQYQPAIVSAVNGSQILRHFTSLTAFSNETTTDQRSEPEVMAHHLFSTRGRPTHDHVPRLLPPGLVSHRKLRRPFRLNVGRPLRDSARFCASTILTRTP